MAARGSSQSGQHFGRRRGDQYGALLDRVGCRLKAYHHRKKGAPVETVWLDRINVNPNICFGKPIIRGMRFPVKDVLGMLAGGMTPSEILDDFPYLEADDIRACLEYAAAHAAFREAVPVVA